ncbi:uncharacterized protein LOC132741407, partial [Ruditapes philippinarum]|uniref:uncharacterized protein LOC132741407 n=1 Tax=Ruditapes philippinarum TaxID=129788 RepID=UPI00295ABED4
MVYLLLSCPGGCPNGSHFHDRQASNPCDATKQEFEIRWNITAEDTEIEFVYENGTLNRTFIVPGVQLDFDVMIMAAFLGSANFTVDLPEKDCDKIISDDADNYGIEFIVPTSTSTSTKIFLTNASPTIKVHVKVYDSDGTLKEEHVVSTSSTSMITTAPSKVLFIRATAEISVYAVHLDASNVNVYGYSVIPVDVLGPNYHVFPDSSNEECTSYSFAEYSSHKTVIETKPYKADQYLFQEGRPRAVFCSTSNYLVQIPPRESLGTQHFIPSLDIVTNEEAEIRLVASEDSTVVTIRGNYDNLDTIDLNGDGYTREVVPNMVYNISSTKPILVLLQIKATTNVWTSVIAIPPVRQYKTQHHFHNFNDDPMILLEKRTRYATDENGNVGSQPSIGIQAFNNPETYLNKTFVLDILQLESSVKLLVPGNVMYTSKKVCTITKGVPGDNIDNDCDGLVDEEQCTVDIIPGEIDADIDGALNEDCASGTTPKPVTSFKLPLREETIDCPTTSSTTEEPTNTEGNAADNRPRIVIDNGVSHDINPPTSFPQKAIQYGEGPSYTPLASSGGGIDIFGSPSTTPSPGSTA